MKLDFGSVVEIKHKNNTIYRGVYLKKRDGIIELKLENGYNIGIDEKNIAGIKVLKRIKASVNKSSGKKRSKKSKKPLIYILHTGGTIASKVDYNTGAVHPLFNPEELISMFPEIENYAEIKTKMLFNVLSEDLNFNNYNDIAEEIYKIANEGKAKGIIISQGTDTMHYTASALSFIIENLNIPVILVGAQRSSDRGSSDAHENLMNAVYFIIKSDFKGVAISMHLNSDDDAGVILPAQNSRKMHTSRRDAFKPINRDAIAFVKNKKIELLESYWNVTGHEEVKGEIQLKFIKPELRIGVIKSRPNLPYNEISFYNAYDGVVIEGTGLGHINLSNKKLKKELKALASRIPVVMASQCINGRINMNVYSRGRELKEIGVIGNMHTMTPETAYIKLAWLLSNYPKRVKELFTKDFRGEIISRLKW